MQPQNLPLTEFFLRVVSRLLGRKDPARAWSICGTVALQVAVVPATRVSSGWSEIFRVTVAAENTGAAARSGRTWQWWQSSLRSELP